MNQKNKDDRADKYNWNEGDVTITFPDDWKPASERKKSDFKENLEKLVGSNGNIDDK